LTNPELVSNLKKRLILTYTDNGKLVQKTSSQSHRSKAFAMTAGLPKDGIKQMNILRYQINKTISEVSSLFNLTPRENEITLLLSLYGYNNKELAEILVISEKTLKNHIANILIKTKSNSTRQLLSLVINFQADAYPYEHKAQ
jgi:DNA-binding CsgD family transcriptional regulator